MAFGLSVPLGTIDACVTGITMERKFLLTHYSLYDDLLFKFNSGGDKELWLMIWSPATVLTRFKRFIKIIELINF